MKSPHLSLSLRFVTCLALLALSAGGVAGASSTNDAVARIRDEGLNRSQVMDTLAMLTEVIGPRLTASPNLKRANDWTRDKLTSWGLTNANLEPWPFGRGWSLKRFSAQVVEPQHISVIGVPNAWTPGLAEPLVADVVFLDVKSTQDLEQYKGKLAGKIVLSGNPREMRPPFEPAAVRLGETNLLRLANAGPPRGFDTSPLRLGMRPSELTNAPSGSNAVASSGPRRRPAPRSLSFLQKEGAALVVYPSPIGDAGSVFVAGASLPTPEGLGSMSFAAMTNLPRAWSTNAPPTLPQITIAAEDYNRLVRMLNRGEKLKMAVDLKVEFHADDLMTYNTVAEILGTDLKDEIVMAGGHLDSWHGGTGATDNATGVAAAMEAMRILAALDLKPRRTIRIGLWSGEEQGLLGSKAYVAHHLGYYTNSPTPPTLASPKDSAVTVSLSEQRRAPREQRRLIKGPDYEKFSAYFNLDNGAGKIRGIYLQGNEALRPTFRKWLEPFADLGAETITLANTGGTDHQSFDAIGLPGFQFIQDPLDYSTRTHHSNLDNYDRVIPDDLKQASVIIATFLYKAAMEDEKLPRKVIPNL